MNFQGSGKVMRYSKGNIAEFRLFKDIREKMILGWKQSSQDAKKQ